MDIGGAIVCVILIRAQTGNGEGYLGMGIPLLQQTHVESASVSVPPEIAKAEQRSAADSPHTAL